MTDDNTQQTRSTHDAPGDSPLDDSALHVSTVIEALLFSSDRPLPASRLAQLVGTGDAGDVREHIARLNEGYERTGASFRIESIAKGYQMMTLPAFDRWVGQLVQSRKDLRLTSAALETLAIVAYKQPVLRAQIDSIRGVASGEVLARLRELNLVKIVGRAEELGRPLLYGTTTRFLEVFGLGSLKDLPTSEVLAPPRESPSPAIQGDDAGRSESASNDVGAAINEPASA